MKGSLKQNLQTTQKTVWMDSDPGLDDTIAIIYAAKSKGINLLGISTSAGNTSLENTTKNSLDILFNIGRQDVPVVKGSPQLVYGKPKYSEQIHGEGGLGGVTLPASPKKPIVQNNFQAIKDHILQSKEKVIWANTGALTNLCLLFQKFPEVKTNIEIIVIMGGAIGQGNSTPAAEFNILFDPVAYERVLKNKGQIPLVMIPLELTHQVRAKDPIFNFLKQYQDIPMAKAILSMLEAFKEMYFKCEEFDYPPVHDACVINYILHPENFVLKKARIVVDTGSISYGRTNCYFKDPQDMHIEIDSIDRVAVKMKKRSSFWRNISEIFVQIFENKRQ